MVPGGATGPAYDVTRMVALVGRVSRFCSGDAPADTRQVVSKQSVNTHRNRSVGGDRKEYRGEGEHSSYRIP